MLASAYDIAVENNDVMIYYRYINNNWELEVTYKDNNYNSYSGDVNIPEKVTYKGQTLPVTSIGEKAFYECEELKSVTIPNTVTSIGRSAFENCYYLTSVNLGSSVTSIGKWAFFECSSLTDVTIPNSVNTIEEEVFYNCYNLSSVTFGNSVNTIGGNAFCNCFSLADVDLPNSVTTIEYRAFQCCESLTSVTIGNSVESIGNYTFAGCSKLAWVKIGNSVKSIGYEAFCGCYELTDVNLPSSLTSIGYSAFEDCLVLKSITIPNSVESIGEKAFQYCYGLTSVTSKMVNPFPINDNCFIEEVYNNITLYVPNGTAGKYNETAGWSNFLYIEEKEPVVTSANSATESIPVLISARDGMLTVKSELEGQSVAVYTIDGKALGSAKVKGGQAIIATNQPKGTIVVVKVGDQSVKVKM